MQGMNFSAPSIHSRRRTTTLVGRDDGLLRFEVLQASSNQLTDHTSDAAAAASGFNNGAYLAMVFSALLAKAEIHKVFRLGAGLLGCGFRLGHNALLRVVNGVQKMSVDKELFQAAATITAGIFQAAKTPGDLTSLVHGSTWREHFVRAYLELNQAALDIHDLKQKAQGHPLNKRHPEEPTTVTWD